MSQEVTDYLRSWNRDAQQALDHVMPLVVRELRFMAARFLAAERAAHTLQATALVNELYLRLRALRRISWRDRAHFFGFAARLMRRILVDHARARASDKRGGRVVRVAFEEAWGQAPAVDLDLVALDEALDLLATLDPFQHQIVELRFFAGLTVREIADLLGIGTATVQRRWASARAWLYQALATPSPHH